MLARTFRLTKLFSQKQVLVERPVQQYEIPTWHLEDISNRPGPISKNDLLKFTEDGYLLVKGIFADSEMDACKRGIDELTTVVAKALKAAGKITNTHEGVCWLKRLILIEEQFQGASVLFHKLGFMHDSFVDIYQNKNLLDVMYQTGLGPTIAAHPVWNLRTKLPKHSETTVPWHQDNSYVPPDTWHEKIMAAWIPLVPVDETNGCMEYIKGAHLTGKTARHTVCEGNTWYTELSDEEISKTLYPKGNFSQDLKQTVPCGPGDAIVFGPANPHRSLPNKSDHVRWSLDLRYHSVNPDRKNPLDMFYGVKESLILKKEGEPDFVPDWTSWKGENRLDAERAISLKGNDGIHAHRGVAEDEIDTIIVGNWMDLWDITAPTNKHIEKYMKANGLWEKVQADLSKGK
jgi:hypothetical protein